MGKTARYDEEKIWQHLQHLILADQWTETTEHMLALASFKTGNDRSLPLYAASMGGNHCSYSECCSVFCSL